MGGSTPDQHIAERRNRLSTQEHPEIASTYNNNSIATYRNLAKFLQCSAVCGYIGHEVLCSSHQRDVIPPAL